MLSGKFGALIRDGFSSSVRRATQECRESFEVAQQSCRRKDARSSGVNFPDSTLVANRRGAANRLGLALQLCALRYLGFVPPDLSVAPQPAVRFVADQLEVSPKALQGYACREQTRREHRAEIRQHLGFSVPRPRDLLALETWLVDRALEHDSPRLLFRLSGERLRSQNLVSPSPDRVVRLVTSARSRALDRTYALLEPLLNAERRVQLDDILQTSVSNNHSTIKWLGQGASGESPDSINAEVEKLAFLRRLGAHE